MRVELFVPEVIAAATLVVETRAKGFTEITRDSARFLSAAKAKDGALLLFIRHTSASLLIQENADPDVRSDLTTALARLAPDGAGWVHDVEGADDMPAHVKTMLTGVCLHVPVHAGVPVLGTWQGITSPSTATPRTGARSFCSSSAAAPKRARSPGNDDASEDLDPCCRADADGFHPPRKLAAGAADRDCKHDRNRCQFQRGDQRVRQCDRQRARGLPARAAASQRQQGISVHFDGHRL
jgi:secondary thiamine-phosphate synthase enzyme